MRENFWPKPNTETARNRKARAGKGWTFVAWQTVDSDKHVEDSVDKQPLEMWRGNQIDSLCVAIICLG
jgi:hypothetical protein